MFQVVTKRSKTRCAAKCEPGWHYYKQCRCYRLVEKTSSGGMTQAQAAAECTSLKGQLASIHSEEENNFLAGLSKLIHPGIVLMVDGASQGK